MAKEDEASKAEEGAKKAEEASAAEDEANKAEEYAGKAEEEGAISAARESKLAFRETRLALISCKPAVVSKTRPGVERERPDPPRAAGRELSDRELRAISLLGMQHHKSLALIEEKAADISGQLYDAYSHSMVSLQSGSSASWRGNDDLQGLFVERMGSLRDHVEDSRAKIDKKVLMPGLPPDHFPCEKASRSARFLSPRSKLSSW